jgi:hypothetical protein
VPLICRHPSAVSAVTDTRRSVLRNSTRAAVGVPQLRARSQTDSRHSCACRAASRARISSPGGLGLLGDFYGVSRIVQKLVEVPALDAEQRQTGQEAAVAPQRDTVVRGVGEGGFGEVGVTFRGSGLSRVV